jgi:uncharacterized protein YecT (DUF1311 family)
MPTDDSEEGRTSLGFHSYADDTPRDADRRPHRGPEPRSWDDAEGWGEPLTFHRHEAPRPDPPPIGEDLPERRANVWPKVAVGAAVLAAFCGGLLVANTDRPTATSAKRPVTEAAAMAAAQPMNLEVAKPTPIPVPPVSSSTKLEVLPPSTGPVASLTPRLQAPPAREEPFLRIAPAPAPIAPAAPPAAPAAQPAPPDIAEAAPPRDAVAVAAPPGRASFDCRDAPTAARAMVCEDAGLAAMDRRMKRAYAAALAAGAPESELAADQRDWLAIREEAARYSRRSVVNIYRQRIDELEAMGERSW